MSTNILPTEWQLYIKDDYIALEYDEQLNLQYSPRPSNLISRFENENQFIRSTVSVTIEDNDSKAYSLILNLLELNAESIRGEKPVHLHNLQMFTLSSWLLGYLSW